MVNEYLFHADKWLPVRAGGRALLLALTAWMAQTVPSSQVAIAQGPPRAAPVSVVPVEKRIFTRKLQLLGEVEAIRMSRPSAEVEGLVREILVDEGDRVEEGQVLLRQDTGIREIDKRRAEAELRNAREQLQEYRAGSRKEEIREAEEAVNGARTLKEEADRDLKRIQALYEKAMASDQEFTAAKAKFLVAQHLYQEKQAAYDLVKTGPRPEVIARAEAQVAIMQADLDRIVDEIRRAEIRAPFAGIITGKLAEKGDFVAKGGSVFSMVQMDPIRVSLTVPELAIDRITRGQEISISLDALPGEKFSGGVNAVIPLADRAARTFPVKVRLENKALRILPGMAARGEVLIPSAGPALAVPSDAIVRTETGFLVYAVRKKEQQNVAAMVPVEVGLSDGGLVEVRGPLKEGELVVVRGNEGLFPNTPVQILENPKKPGNPGEERPRP